MIEVSKKAMKAVKSFEYLDEIKLFKRQGNEISMHLFLPQLNGREFYIEGLKNSLSEVVLDFTLSRSTIQKYKEDENYMAMTRDARSKFRNYTSNTGELGELFLFTFLEGHLEAPKILSKMALKTSPNDYVKQSDGIHYLYLEDTDRYHLIYGESKMYKNLSGAFKQAFQSISLHSDNQSFEKSLISAQIDNEFLNEKDKKLIEDLIYPTKSLKDIKVSDAFGIFIGFEFDDSGGVTMSEDDYESWVQSEVKNMIGNLIEIIEGYIKDEWTWSANNNKYTKKNLIRKSFYVYLMPITNLQDSRENITKGIAE